MKTFAQIVQHAFKKGYSDVHLKAGSGLFHRRRGRILRDLELGIDPGEIDGLVRSTLTDLQREHLERDRKVDYSLQVVGEARVRGIVYFQRGLLAATYRIIPMKVPTMDRLGIPKVAREMTLRPRGLVVIAGPGGSGKTTTAACLVDEVNRSVCRHIVTIEDPIEYVFKDAKSVITQREVGANTLSFHMGLKAALRQDPDVVFIGEMRDLETFITAITMAETGHLVISTVQSIGACETVDRIVNMFPTEQQEQIRTQLSLNIQGIISQLLLPRGQDTDELVAAIEVLYPTSAIRALIRKGEVVKIKGAMETSLRDGCMPMKSAIDALFSKGQISEASRDKALDYTR